MLKLMDFKNKEGYADPTAYFAIKNLMKNRTKRKKIKSMNKLPKEIKIRMVNMNVY